MWNSCGVREGDLVSLSQGGAAAPLTLGCGVQRLWRFAGRRASFREDRWRRTNSQTMAAATSAAVATIASPMPATSSASDGGCGELPCRQASQHIPTAAPISPGLIESDWIRACGFLSSRIIGFSHSAGGAFRHRRTISTERVYVASTPKLQSRLRMQRQKWGWKSLIDSRPAAPIAKRTRAT